MRNMYTNSLGDMVSPKVGPIKHTSIYIWVIIFLCCNYYNARFVTTIHKTIEDEGIYAIIISGLIYNTKVCLSYSIPKCQFGWFCRTKRWYNFCLPAVTFIKKKK